MITDTLDDAEIETVDGPHAVPSSGGISADLGGGRATATDVLDRVVGDPEAFRTGVWGKRAWWHDAGSPVTELMTPADVDRIITSSAVLRVSAIRLVRDGTAVPPSRYITTGRHASRYDGVADVQRMINLATEGLADPDRVLRALDDGATVVLQGVHRFHAPAAQICRELELALGVDCQANAYVTPPGARGLQVHDDPHDVFVLQTFGSKLWEVHPTPWERANRHGATATEVTLDPGCVQYLPTGTPHAARGQQYLSGHLTIGLTPTTWADLVREAAERALVELDGRLSDPLPADWLQSPERLRAGMDEGLAALRAAIADTDAGDLVAQRVRGFLTDRRRAMLGAFVDRALLPELLPDTRLVRRPGSVCRLVAADDGRVALLAGDRTLLCPARLATALELVATRPTLTPADLFAVLVPEAAMTLCRRLVREAVLTLHAS
jgi:bifunctional lysine-specific demethylase and histidyl-hydroxylase NO66